MRHAVIDNNTVVNIIEIDPRNASDFGNAVTIPDGLGAGIGDAYRDGRFYRTDPETQQEEELLPFDAALQALALARHNAEEITSTMLELTALGQEQTTLLLK